MKERLWFREGFAWRLIALGYLPWLGILSLAWEAAHVRLYTLWDEARPAYIAFAVLHCTLGDVLIGALSLLLALTLLRERVAAEWRWMRIAVLAVVLCVGYTVFSEWMNLTILRSWAYGEAMPRIELVGVEVGLTPLAQWLFVPPLALYLARRMRGKAQATA